ncbi:hypothetical protein Tco_0071555 [Tanacetum coccineum]
MSTKSSESSNSPADFVVVGDVDADSPKAVTFNLDQTSRYSSNYDDNSVNRINIIEMACEEYSQEVLGFSDVIAIDHSYYTLEGDILLLEAFLNDDPSLPPPTQGNYFPEIRKELKVCEVKNDKSSIDEPPEVKLKDLPPHLEYAFLEGDDKLPIIIAKDTKWSRIIAHSPIKGFRSHAREPSLGNSPTIKGLLTQHFILTRFLWKRLQNRGDHNTKDW